MNGWKEENTGRSWTELFHKLCLWSCVRDMSELYKTGHPVLGVTRVVVVVVAQTFVEFHCKLDKGVVGFGFGFFCFGLDFWCCVGVCLFKVRLPLIWYKVAVLGALHASRISHPKLTWIAVSIPALGLCIWLSLMMAKQPFLFVTWLIFLAVLKNSSNTCLTKNATSIVHSHWVVMVVLL